MTPSAAPAFATTMSEAERDSSASASPPAFGNDYSDPPQKSGRDASPELISQGGTSPKRNAGNPVAGTAAKLAQKQTKRRAARACVSCRARKVRCDVVENLPCANCKWDGVKCEVQESRRRKKTYHSMMMGQRLAGAGSAMARKNTVPLGVNMAPQLRMAPTDFGGHGSISDVAGGMGLLYQRSLPQFVPNANTRLMAGGVSWNATPFGPNPGFAPQAFRSSLEETPPPVQLPAYIKPLPARLCPLDTNYLYKKGALIIPTPTLQTALLKAYVEFVHPYMPLLPLHDVLRIIGGQEQGPDAKIGLFLYQAVMFVSVAFVDERYLLGDDYQNRKAARKAFFSRVRLLYDFDIESERHVLVQALLLMTYWYETPDEEKDTWHWMGVAISLAHTIGLHRNPTKLTTINLQKQRLFKRIWWSCFMRDRLIALGMRRPTRIQDEDFDVPMLEESDFEIEALPDGNQFLGPDCKLIRDRGLQRQLALMCIEKAKLCVLISRVLKVQYSVLSRDAMRPDNTTDSTMMVYPNKTLDNVERIQRLDEELNEWLINLPDCCRSRPLTEAEISNGDATIALHRTLLHMIYRATVAALHRPQFLPAQTVVPGSVALTEIQEIAHRRVHESAQCVMTMAAQLRQFKLDRYLPTTGVTAILPAMIIHLFEMKRPDPIASPGSTERFQQGMEVLEQLKKSYAAADFAAKFLEAAYIKLQLGTSVAFQRQKISTRVEPTMVDMMGNMAGSMGGEPPSTPPLIMPNHGGFMGAAEIHSQYPDHSGLPRDFSGLIIEPRPGSLTPPSSDSELEQFVNITPAGNTSERQRAPEPTVTMGAGADMSWDSYSMSNQQQSNMDSDLEVSQWLQFPAEGVSNSDEVMIEMVCNTDGAGDVDSYSYNWLKGPQDQQLPLHTFQHNIRGSDMEDLDMTNLRSAGTAA